MTKKVSNDRVVCHLFNSTLQAAFSAVVLGRVFAGKGIMAEQTLLESKTHQLSQEVAVDLCGVLPLGIFFCFHMVANYTFTWSVPAYDAFSHFSRPCPTRICSRSRSSSRPLSCTLLSASISLRWKLQRRFLSLHAQLALSFQRITGVIAFAFLLWHVIGLKWGVSLLADGGSTFETGAQRGSESVGACCFRDRRV